MHDFKLGDRVTRMLFLDDGTWNRFGDECLKYSPLRTGTVIKIFDKQSPYGGTDHLFKVKWDDGKIGNYFQHGIDLQG